jgi:hypothetical protein
MTVLPRRGTDAVAPLCVVVPGGSGVRRCLVADAVDGVDPVDQIADPSAVTS